MIRLFNDTNFEYVESEDSLTIFNDCISTLKSIKDKSVDLIFADPPYNLGKDFGNENDSWENKNEYLNWCYRWIDECFRVLKDNGTFYLMNSTQNMPYISMIINDIVWVYDSSGVQSKKKYGSLYEPILMAAKSDKTKYTFNHEDI